MTWTTASIPDLSGKTALVTGPSTGGIGFYTALELARAGAQVLLAGRTPAKLHEAAAAIADEVPTAVTEPLVIEMASLDSIRTAAATVTGPLDILINNAGVMATPHTRTVDGFEQQLGTNHLGSFLLTGLLLPRLAEAGGRVVNVSSIGHNAARRAPLGDPRQEPKRYDRWQAYFQSKLANLLFTYEAARRFDAARVPVSTYAAHPGFAGTHLVGNGSSFGAISGVGDRLYKLTSQSPAAGAEPTLMAATASLPSGTFVGPSRRGRLVGPPVVQNSSKKSYNQADAAALWDLSEKAVGISYP
jgi:NAD(P)-dependent dehydrogenase (short-subunit alcohol dehydrogenase family)